MSIWYFLPGIIVLGLITSYEDIRFGKIRNKWVLTAVALAALTHLLLHSQFFEVLANFLLACAVGFLLWIARLWTAGDGKLFIAFAALLPGLNLYSLDLLFNIFLVSIAVLLLVAFQKFRLANFSFRGSLSPVALLKSVVCVFSVYWLASMLPLPGRYAASVLTVAVLLILQPARLRTVFYFLIAVSVARLFFDSSSYSAVALLHLVLMVASYRLAMVLLSLSSVKEVSAKKLVPGMLLAETLAERKPGKIAHGKTQFYKKDRGVLDFGGFVNEDSEGLTVEQIRRLRSTGFKAFRIAETIPFAQFIFLGALATLLFNGNVLITLLNL